MNTNMSNRTSMALRLGIVIALTAGLMAATLYLVVV